MAQTGTAASGFSSAPSIDGASSLEGGFADAVFDSQAAFSRLMTALSRPGTIVSLDGLARPPAPLPTAAGAVLLALADADTPVWLDETFDGGASRTGFADAGRVNGPVADWLAFHTGAPLAGTRAEARFACLRSPSQTMLDGFAIGSSDYPDRSTTLIVELFDFTSGPSLRLSGPGIEATTSITPAGLPGGFPAAWAGNRALYPRGVDLLLVAGDRLIGLPRTTTIEEA